MDARRTRPAVAPRRHRPGDRLYADPLAGLHPLSRRRPHLPEQQRRRTRITWNCLGRRAWLFAGSDRGGERAAAIYTLIATAKLNDINPQAWLADVLARIDDHPASRASPLALEKSPTIKPLPLDAQHAAVLGGCLRENRSTAARPAGLGVSARSHWARVLL
jgi:IS66 C-terminal element